MGEDRPHVDSVPNGYKYRLYFSLLLIYLTSILGMFPCHNIVFVSFLQQNIIGF
jgi:hypothetical protein